MPKLTLMQKSPPLWGGTLLLPHFADDLVAVLGAVALAGDVNPVDAAVGGFFDELVKEFLGEHRLLGNFSLAIRLSSGMPLR